MKLHHVIAASLLALASAGAQAVSTLAGPGAITLIDGQTTTTSHSGIGTVINDSWTLNVDETPGAADIVIGFSDIPMTFAGMSFNITGMGVSGTPAFTGSGDSYSYTGSLLNGVYNITVTGTVAGASGGFYQTAFNAAPVPLPPAALLFGSALIGLAGLRRRKAAKELVEA